MTTLYLIIMNQKYYNKKLKEVIIIDCYHNKSSNIITSFELFYLFTLKDFSIKSKHLHQFFYNIFSFYQLL